MTRAAMFVYGVANYLLFFAVYAYMAGFVGNFFVPKSIDAPLSGESVGWAVAINLALVAVFALQHSVMARPGFKAIWTQLVPQPIERSTYMLFSSAVLILLMWQWRPIDTVVWSVSSGVGYYLLTGLFIVGWLMVPTVSLMINHFDLFGLRQIWLHLRGRENAALPFKTPMLYGYMRHPLYVGWFLAFWATPTMTVGHLLFAASLTVYMVLASKVEERDLVQHFGKTYEEYRRRVPAFVPRLGRPTPTLHDTRATPTATVDPTITDSQDLLRA
jgi:protein-S-isoprenylcysteine O-methyltransferase Ste14